MSVQKVRIAGRAVEALVAKQLSGNEQGFAGHDRMRGEGVPQIVNARIRRKLCCGSDAIPVRENVGQALFSRPPWKYVRSPAIDQCPLRFDDLLCSWTDFYPPGPELGAPKD
jgi:hypothetical protein